MKRGVWIYGALILAICMIIDNEITRGPNYSSVLWLIAIVVVAALVVCAILPGGERTRNEKSDNNWKET